MSYETVVLTAEFSRRIPDPVFRDRRMQRHIFFCRASALPPNLPKDPNPRGQNVDRGIYREVAKSLMNESGTPGTFHLKNKGITIIADDVDELGDGKYELRFMQGQGIVDGAHTYEIINSYRDECPDNQYVRVEVLTSIDNDLITEIAGGLNTAMQVQSMSLANLAGEFDWIKQALEGTEFADKIAYRENEHANVDVRDVVALLTLFNVELYPHDGQDYPIKAYTSKAYTLEQYLKHKKSFQKMRPILEDIFRLHDKVHLVARDQHNKAGGKAGALAFMKARKRGAFILPFTGQETKYMLYDGALYPMLGALRWMVQLDGQRERMVWKTEDGINGVIRLLENVAAELMRSTLDKSTALGRNPNAIGKDRGHWENLFKTVALREMMG